MARCQNRGQFVEGTDGMAAERKSKEKLQPENENYVAGFDVDGEKVGGMERAKSVERESRRPKRLYQRFF